MDSKLNIYTPVRMHNVVVAIVVGVISDKLQRVRLHHTHTYTNQSCTTAFEGRSPCTHAYNIHTSQSTITTMFIECCAHINTSPAQKKSLFLRMINVNDTIYYILPFILIDLLAGLKRLKIRCIF